MPFNNRTFLVWFSNGIIRKPYHLESRQLSTVQKPDMFSFWILTVLWMWFFEKSFFGYWSDMTYKSMWQWYLDKACILAHAVEWWLLVTQQIFGRIKLHFFSLGKNQNFGVIQDCVETVGDGDDGTIRKLDKNSKGDINVTDRESCLGLEDCFALNCTLKFYL